MVGVPAASAATTLLLFVVGLAGVGLAAAVFRSRLRGLPLDARLATAALGLSLVAAPWLVWRFAEDLRTTTRYDSYERANAGPIQAFLPGYLVDGARSLIPPTASWATAVGPSDADPIAQKTFPALALVALFPRVSAPPSSADWIIGWGVDPRRVARVGRVAVAHPRQGPLPPVLVAPRRR
ncbi:MAG: hypothetical protein ACXVZ4_07715 [Gaiellaceae bacterium]